MKKHIKHVLAWMLTAAMLFGLLPVLTGCNTTKDDADTFTIWMGSSVDSAYYTNYGQNPVIQYIEKKFDIDLEFITPAVGNETDNFNTLIATGDYPDMMDLSFYTGTIADLYDNGDGVCLDLTQYVNDYMPNYKNFVETHKNGATAYATVGGKYLTLNNYNAAVPQQWGGYVYRRDWLVKYGTDPVTGGTFKSWEENGVYRDDVNFPDGYLDSDGNENPLTVADWEWMFSQFEKCPDYAYAISMGYRGYQETGEFLCAWNTGALWNTYDEDGDGFFETVRFGAGSEEFRDYLETMKTWYDNGWLDPDFATRTGDMFYQIDANTVYQGKVGAWYGTGGQLGSAIESAEQPATLGIDVWAAPQPKLTADAPDPTIFYQDSMETTRTWMITDAIEGKNVEKFMEMIDWLYSEEGMRLHSYGLTKEQMAEFDIDLSLMTQYGLTEGTYYKVNERGEKDPNGNLDRIADIIFNDSGNLAVAVSSTYFIGLGAGSYEYYSPDTTPDDHRKNMAQEAWSRYENKGTVSNSLLAQMDAEAGQGYRNTQAAIRDYLAIEVPKFIKGQTELSDKNWTKFQAALKTRKQEKNTDILQSVVDSALSEQ
ncbi:MAG: hypothetical protein E7436_00860 [Ruminococcaceae bacterium]|nr:hypothetical protein [Oscillospiraceae bacterium]